MGDTAKVCYDINNKDKNVSSTDFVIHIIDTFIKKLMADNTEMFNQLGKYKEIVETQKGQLQRSLQEENIRDVKYENMLLKQQIQTLVEQLNGGGDTMSTMDKKGGMNKTAKKKLYKKRSGSSTSSINNNVNNNNNYYFNINISGSNLNGGDKQKYEIEPIKKLKLKIKNLKDKIKGSDINYNNDDE